MQPSSARDHCPTRARPSLSADALRLSLTENKGSYLGKLPSVAGHELDWVSAAVTFPASFTAYSTRVPRPPQT
jgi:hypothetical protein